MDKIDENNYARILNNHNNDHKIAIHAEIEQELREAERQTLLNKLEEEVEKLETQRITLPDEDSEGNRFEDGYDLVELDDIKSIIAKLKRGGE